jgi:glycosyltransferase involved in cell wall biosynthesis
VTDLPTVEAPSYCGYRKLRLAYFVSHPIQYQAPMLRRIAREPDIELKVFFSSDISVRKTGYTDQGFGVVVKWDTPLLEGYEYEFLPVLRDAARLGFARPINYGISRRIREQEFDAVWLHSYSTLTNLQAIGASNWLKIPALLRTDSTLFDRPRSHMKLAVKKLFFDFLRPRISGLLSVGDANTEYWRHYFGELIPIFPCHYAVDNQFFRRECEMASLGREEFRKSLELDARRPVILFAAKLTPRKRCGDLVEAYLRLSESCNLQPAPYLLIVGDGELRSVLEEKARRARPGDIRFLGFRNQSELPKFYDLCSVFVLASVDEPWGLAINEVMNAGRAVIVTDQVGCQKNLVKHGVNGRVVRARDVQDLAESLRVVLADEKTSEAMGLESLRIIQSFNFDQNVFGLRQALQALVPGFPAAPGGMTERERPSTEPH